MWSSQSLLAALAVLAVVVRVLIGWGYQRRRRLRAVSARQLATGHYGVMSGNCSAQDLPQGAIDGDGYVSPVVSQYDLKKLEKEMQRARSQGDESELAALHLLLGQSAMAGGDTGKAGAQLRDAVILASRLDLHDVHAAARLELGDLAQQAGDLTTACEHWQMARGLFHKLEAQQGFAIADNRMQGNGCPTDWVLNRF